MTDNSDNRGVVVKSPATSVAATTNNAQWTFPQQALLCVKPPATSSSTQGPQSELVIRKTRSNSALRNDGGDAQQNATYPNASQTSTTTLRTQTMPHSKLTWAITTGQDLYVLREIGRVCVKNNPRAFTKHWNPAMPAPFEVCVMHNNLPALKYLTKEVSKDVFDVIRDISMAESDQCIKTAMKSGFDEVLHYLLCDLQLDKYSIAAQPDALAQHGLPTSLEWRITILTASMDTNQLQNTIWGCLEAALQPDACRNPDNLPVIEVLMNFGRSTKTSARITDSPEMLDMMITALKSGRSREAGAMFSAWLCTGGLHPPIGREIVQKLHETARANVQASWISDVLEQDAAFLLSAGHSAGSSNHYNDEEHDYIRHNHFDELTRVEEGYVDISPALEWIARNCDFAIKEDDGDDCDFPLLF